MVTMARDAVRSIDIKAAASIFLYATNPAHQDAPRWVNPLRAASMIYQMPKHRFESDYDDDDEEAEDPDDPFSQCLICGSNRKPIWDPIEAANSLPSGYSGDDFLVLEQVMITRWFTQAVLPDVTRKDESAFRQFLKVIAAAPGKATALHISRLLLKEIKGFVEWSFHFEALGFAGVLSVPKQPGNLQKWTDYRDRKKPLTTEMPTPTCHWRRHMGFDADVFQSLFPNVTLPAKLCATTTA
jgi:hypothetical protein